MLEQLAAMAEKLPAAARDRALVMLRALPAGEMRALLEECKAAARAAQDAKSRAQVVERLLRRIARAAGVELSALEVSVLRAVFVRLVSE